MTALKVTLFTLITGYRVLLILQIVFLVSITDNAYADEDNAAYGSFRGNPVSITSPVLKFVSLNIAHGRKNGLNQILLSADTIRKNLGEAGENFRRLSPHVISLQEADGPSLWSGHFDHVEYLARSSGFPYYASARHSSTPFFRFGTALISAVPMQDVLPVSFTPSPPTLRKGFLVASIPWNPGGRLSSPVQLSLVSIHLDFSRRKVRKKQARELIAHLETVPRPLILSGDFNAEWTGEDATLRDIVHSLGLRAHEPNSAALGTYRSTGKRLDWILISSDLEFAEYATVPEVMSDHLAVSAHIVLK